MICLIHLDPLMLNILIILLAIFIYQFTLFSKFTFHKIPFNYTFALGASLCTILLMLSPFSLSAGNNFDLRKIPFLIAVLYGGPRVGFFVLATMLAFRFYLGGAGVWAALTIYSVLFVCAVMLRSLYNRSPIIFKIMIPALLAAVTSSFGAFFEWIQDPARFSWDNIRFFAIFFAINLLVMAVSILLIENIKTFLFMKEELVRNEKIAATNRLAAAVAHEVRNPLTVSRGFMQLLMEKINDDRLKSYSETAITEIDRAERVISQFLAFSNSENAALRPIDVSNYFQMLQNIMDTFPHIGNIEFNLQYEPDLTMLADSQILTQCLINITKNAVESMPDGGVIKINASKNKTNICLSVIDEGSGMTEEQIRALGTPFYSTKQAGTGLGMLVSYHLVHLMNGKLIFESRPKEGTTVTILLPCG